MRDSRRAPATSNMSEHAAAPERPGFIMAVDASSVDREVRMAFNTNMAAARQILELLKSHVEGDEERFRTAALQLAANEARQGHNDLAKEIQRLVEQSRELIRSE